MAKVIEVKYICNQCKAEDTVKVFPDETLPKVINCWKCRAGVGKEVSEMQLLKVGMFPLLSPKAA